MWYFFLSLIYRLICLIVRAALFFCYRVTFEGRENRPEGKSAIFAANHRSYLDPVLVTLASPRPFNFIAKESLFRVPVFGKFIRVLGAFPTAWPENPDYDVMTEATKRLHKKRYLTIFPEGTRHTDGKVGKGKSGMCVLAAKSGMPVVPVGIIFDSNNLHFRSKIHVRIGKPFYPQDYGLTPDSSPMQMRKMKEDVMESIRCLVEENPPFEILHDEPKKKSSRDRRRDAFQQEKQRLAAEEAASAKQPVSAETAAKTEEPVLLKLPQTAEKQKEVNKSS